MGIKTDDLILGISAIYLFIFIVTIILGIIWFIKKKTRTMDNMLYIIGILIGVFNGAGGGTLLLSGIGGDFNIFYVIPFYCTMPLAILSRWNKRMSGIGLIVISILTLVDIIMAFSGVGIHDISIDMLYVLVLVSPQVCLGFYNVTRKSNIH